MGPETRYARGGDVGIAYQVVGDGPLDLVVVPISASHLGCAWEEPRVAGLQDLVAGSGIAFDDRGEQGLKGVPEPRRLYAARP